MSKRQTYLFILAMGLLLILIGQFMRISFINRLVANTLVWIENPMIFGSAAVCAFVFMNNSKYWMINSGIALAVSLIVQYFVIESIGNVYGILVRAFAFLVVVYLLNLIKVVLDK